MSPADAAELAPLYAEETQLSEGVCLALLRGNIEPPPRWRVDEFGWTGAERDALERFYEYATPPALTD